MAKLRVEVVTGEREVLVQDDVDMVVAPGVEGQLGILPQHAPLITTMVPGVLRIKKGSNEDELAIGGGFLQINNNHVMVLADSAEHSEEIDIARAEEARRRAEAALANPGPEMNLQQVQAAMRRSSVRLNIARKHSRSRPQSTQLPQ